MRALITGGHGQLARKLIATAPRGIEINAPERSECDITDARAVVRVFSSFRPDLVINAAAFTSVDSAEGASDQAFLVNAEGAANVARAADDLAARVIQISTDYVFDGDRSTPYPPDAPTNPLNVYGRSKLEGERLVLGIMPYALVIRVGWLYSRWSKNFLSNILERRDAAGPLRVVSDQVGCPTSATEFADTIWKAAGSPLSGVYHWANLGSATWFEFAMAIATLSRGLPGSGAFPSIVPVTSEEYGSLAPRPRYSVLDCSRLAAELHTKPSPWEKALEAELSYERV